MQTILIVYFVMLCVIGVCLIRNEMVFKERSKMITWIFDQPDWEKKRELLDNPSYNRMVFQFWKPVKSYYKEYLK